MCVIIMLKVDSIYEKNDIISVNEDKIQEFKKKEKHYLKVIFSLFVLAHCCIVFPVLFSYISIEFGIEFLIYLFLLIWAYPLLLIIDYFYSIYAIIKTKHSKKINIISIFFTSIAVLEISFLLITVIRCIGHVRIEQYIV